MKFQDISGVKFQQCFGVIFQEILGSDFMIFWGQFSGYFSVNFQAKITKFNAYFQLLHKRVASLP